LSLEADQTLKSIEVVDSPLVLKHLLHIRYDIIDASDIRYDMDTDTLEGVYDVY